MSKNVTLVTGAGGFVGHHLVKMLVAKGEFVRGVDIKLPEFESSAAQEFLLLDLRHYENCLEATQGVDDVYHLAADTGGIGYVADQHAAVTLNNTLINAHVIKAAYESGARRFLFSSSACVYPQYLQAQTDVTPLREESAFPADPEDGFGFEKLFMEKLCQYFHEDWDFSTRVVRLHKVYGPLATYDGGREKVLAAICRKVALASAGDSIEIWGDGQQKRSFLYIDDCVEGIYRIMQSDYSAPLNLGSDEAVGIDTLVDSVSRIAGKQVAKRHNLKRPLGVRGRSSDNSRLRDALAWEPSTTLNQGLIPTYRWIAAQISAGINPVDQTVAAE